MRGREIHLIRAGEEVESLCGLKYGAIKDITIVKDKKCTGDRNQMILVRIKYLLWCMYPSTPVFKTISISCCLGLSATLDLLAQL